MKKISLEELKKTGEGFTILKMMAEVLGTDDIKYYGYLSDENCLQSIYIDGDTSITTLFLDLYFADEMYTTDSESCIVYKADSRISEVDAEDIYDLSVIAEVIRDGADELESLKDTYELTADTCGKLCILSSIVSTTLRRPGNCLKDLDISNVATTLERFSTVYIKRGKRHAFIHYVYLVGMRSKIDEITSILELGHVF